MTEWINVQEAMGILEEHYIQVSYKTFTDWLRKLEIPAVPSENRKEGWAIRQEDIFEFIERKRPGLRQILQEYQNLIRDMNEVKQQVQILLHNKENVALEHSEEKKGVSSSEVDFLYEMLHILLEEVEELTIQNQEIEVICEQLMREVFVLKKSMKKNNVKVGQGDQVGIVVEESVPKLEEENFQKLLRAKFKNLFPNRKYPFKGEKEEQLYQFFCDLAFPKEDKHFGLIKQGNEYIYQRTGDRSSQVNRVYNKIIGELLENLEKEQKNEVSKEEEGSTQQVDPEKAASAEK
ncbi:helix-turn-helix domain-containing protein [Bacillus mobilis]|uniref:helix-turn-helix domain-containing protein n=1 Tax=Bacillus mobilis TaxID=2026190 RepID=UPI002E241899|nr:helix-turn-helix domain-containing protein [Bacillus mobilis]MED0956304.1 helix-turn-helix domain-containing protein [Bacillus mobilis]